MCTRDAHKRNVRTVALQCAVHVFHKRICPDLLLQNASVYVRIGRIAPIVVSVEEWLGPFRVNVVGIYGCVLVVFWLCSGRVWFLCGIWWKVSVLKWWSFPKKVASFEYRFRGIGSQGGESSRLFRFVSSNMKIIKWNNLIDLCWNNSGNYVWVKLIFFNIIFENYIY